MTGTPKDPTPGSGRPPKAGGEGPSASEFAGVGLQFAVSIIGGLYLGQWLDRKLGTAPWLLIVGVFAGAGLSFYSMYSKLMKAQARDDAAREARKNAEKKP